MLACESPLISSESKVKHLETMFYFAVVLTNYWT